MKTLPSDVCLVALFSDVTEFSLTHRSQKHPTAAKNLKIRIMNPYLQNKLNIARGM